MMKQCVRGSFQNRSGTFHGAFPVPPPSSWSQDVGADERPIRDRVHSGMHVDVRDLAKIWVWQHRQLSACGLDVRGISPVGVETRGVAMSTYTKTALHVERLVGVVSSRRYRVCKVRR